MQCTMAAIADLNVERTVLQNKVRDRCPVVRRERDLLVLRAQDQHVVAVPRPAGHRLGVLTHHRRRPPGVLCARVEWNARVSWFRARGAGRRGAGDRKAENARGRLGEETSDKPPPAMVTGRLESNSHRKSSSAIKISGRQLAGLSLAITTTPHPKRRIEAPIKKKGQAQSSTPPRPSTLPPFASPPSSL